MKTHSRASALTTADKRKSPKAYRSSTATYPFAMIVGQEEMKLALILNVIDPLIGGALLMGHRGTGKSTAVRALADLLGEIWSVRGCLYRCDPTLESELCSECSARVGSGEKLTRQRLSIPLVDLPLGATEDRVVGAIDIERALKAGVKSFEPGLLARANRGFLYVDEVNLLEDHLADLLLDVAATGRNKVEREGISIEHPSRFVLIGSGNPEEGELRPQLLDRFGLHVEVKTEEDLDKRVEIVERREDFENHPADFSAGVARDQEQIRKSITRARTRAQTLKVDRPLLRRIAQLCSQLKIDGHRGELTIARSARALAAFEGRSKITEEDVRRVAVMSLRHRLRRDPLEETAGAEQIRQALDNVFQKPKHSRAGSSDAGEGSDGFDSDGSGHIREPRDIARSRSHSAGPSGGRGSDSSSEPSKPAQFDVGLPKLSISKQRHSEVQRSGSHQSRNRARRTVLNYQRGRYTGAVNLRKMSARVAVDATLRAMAGTGCQVSGVGCQVSGVGSQVSGVRYRVSGVGSQVPGVRQNHSLKPDTQHPAPDTQHPTPNTQHPAPDTQHPTPNTQHPAPDTRHPAPSHSLRYKLLAGKSGTLFILLIDASGSMALKRISLAKGAALSLLKDSYIKRDKVAIIGFRGSSAELLLPPSKSMLRARRVLDSLGVGGGTPLAAGLLCSLKLAKRAQTGVGEIVLLVFTDGNPNVSLQSASKTHDADRRKLIEREIVHLGSELKRAGVRTIVVDSRNGFVSSEKTRELADTLHGTYVTSRKVLTAAVADSTNP